MRPAACPKIRLAKFLISTHGNTRNRLLLTTWPRLRTRPHRPIRSIRRALRSAMPRWKTVSMPPDSVPAGRHKSSSADALQMARRAQGSDTGPPVLEIAVARHRSRPVPTPTDPVHALLSESQRRDCRVPLPVLLSGFPRDAPLAFPATPTARRL